MLLFDKCKLLSTLKCQGREMHKPLRVAGGPKDSDGEAEESSRKRHLEAFLKVSFSAELLLTVRSPLTKQWGK